MECKFCSIQNELHFNSIRAKYSMRGKYTSGCATKWWRGRAIIPKLPSMVAHFLLNFERLCSILVVGSIIFGRLDSRPSYPFLAPPVVSIPSRWFSLKSSDDIKFFGSPAHRLKLKFCRLFSSKVQWTVPSWKFVQNSPQFHFSVKWLPKMMIEH